MAAIGSIARPRTLPELAELAAVDDYNPSGSIKSLLRFADTLRRQGMQYFSEDDYERAFVFNARAATMILEKIPRHPGYGSLTTPQRKALASNGDRLLQFISDLKPKIIDRYERWKETCGESAYEEIVEAAKEEEGGEVTSRKEEEDDQNRLRVSNQGGLPGDDPETFNDETDQQDPPSTPEESGLQGDAIRTETYLQILRRFQGYSWPNSAASQNYDKLDLSTKVTWEPSATARGHFADIHKGRLENATVAVKLLRLPEYNPYTKEDYEHTYLRFFREMTIWAELRHINIVSMIGFTAAKGVIGLVSPWHEDGNLADHLSANPDVSVPDLMLDVAEGTRYLHETAHLAHGDLKGMNILINQHGIACLTDFGISQQIHDLNRHTGFTTTGAAAGTTHWMAPEVMEGERPHYHSDVYSCAGVFLEICAKKCPFHYLAKSAITAAKLRGELPLRSHYPELDGKDGWWNLFSLCWDAQATKRPTISTVIETLYTECGLESRPINSVALRPIKNRAPSAPSVPSVTSVAPLGRTDTLARLEQTHSGRDPPEDRYRNADVETQAQRMREETVWTQQTRRGREVLEAASQAAYEDQLSSKSRQLPTPPSITYVTPSKKNDFDFPTPQSLPLNSSSRSRSEGEDFLKDSSRYTAPRRTESYPRHIITTSSILNPQVIEYPKLMTAHQQTQGYTPSTSSMFSVPPLLLLQGPSYSLPSASSGTGSSYSSPVHQYPQHSQVPPVHSHPTAFYPLQQPSAQHQPHANSYYNASLPQPSAMPSSYSMSRSNAPLSSLHSHSMPSLTLHDRHPPAPSIPSAAPPRPAKVPVSPPKFVPPATRTSPVNDVPLTATGLRVVRLPRDTLNKFLAIASVNTAQKKETCGLLLGKLKNNAFLIETLLIPRQTATSDTCTMTDEEMVFEFQDFKDLLTLGWIHTHPTQSCFMSSGDLHTHSGFQSMLPEAFAIVCAPKSTPNFGIFRLTDPPGLQLILNCGEKATFHPHPDAPIYTVATHVQMCDGPLEIADLRNDL